jgi:3-deoxy-manno-octulosonate cytidylyltransferase (CMP-KDO synthetase)
VHRSPSPAAERETQALQTPDAVAIIPARLDATRLPEKPLLDLGGSPLIVRVLERVRECASMRAIYVATDSERIAAAVRAAGAEPLLTRSDHRSGMDRVAEAARAIDAEIVVNVQGDEPFVSPEGLEKLVALFRDPAIRMATLAAPFPADEDPGDPHRVKVVTDRAGRALYFSRSAIPDGAGSDCPALLHVGVYAYRRATLLDLAGFRPCPLERAERLEQLRALWNGIPIHVLTGAYGSFGIDTPDDLARARRLWSERRNPR